MDELIKTITRVKNNLSRKERKSLEKLIKRYNGIRKSQQKALLRALALDNEVLEISNHLKSTYEKIAERYVRKLASLPLEFFNLCPSLRRNLLTPKDYGRVQDLADRYEAERRKINNATMLEDRRTILLIALNQDTIVKLNNIVLSYELSKEIK